MPRSRSVHRRRRGGLPEAGAVLLVYRIGRNHPAALAPVPVAREEPVDGRRLAREGDVGGRHLRRHHGDEVVLANELVERIDERLPDVVRALDLDVVGIEKQHEHRARGVCAPSRASRGRCSARGACPAARRANDDVLELLDFLGHAVLEDLEVGLREIGDRRAVFRGKDVDADVVRLGAEGRRRCGGVWATRQREEAATQTPRASALSP